MNLYLTGYDRNRHVVTIRGVRNALRVLDPKADDTTMLAKRIVETFEGHPVLIGTMADDDTETQGRATAELDNDGVVWELSVAPRPDAVMPNEQTEPPAVEREADEPSYLACRNALSILAHVNGAPTNAISMLNGMEFVLPDDHEAVPLIRETRRVIMDSFPMVP